MRKYPQVALLRPKSTLVVWMSILAVSGALCLLWPGIELAPYFQRANSTLRDMLQMMTMFGVGGVLLSLVLIVLVFRTMSSLLFPLSIGAIALSVSFGLMSISGTPLTVPSSWLIVFVLALGTEYSVFVGYSYINQSMRELRPNDGSRPRKIRDRAFALSAGVRPEVGAIMVSAIATSIGFLVMLASDSPELEDLGLFLAIGTMVAGLASLSVIPALIALAPWKVDDEVENTRLLHKMVDGVGGAAARNPIKAFAAMLVLAVVAAAGVAQLSLGDVAKDMLTGLAVAVGILWLYMVVVYRSMRTGALVMLPKLLALVLMFGVLGFLDRPLDPSALLVGIVVLGISVNSTVHFFGDWRYFTSYERKTSTDAAQSSIRKSGKPMLLSAAARTLGAGILLLSSHDPLVWLGAMMCIATLSALVCDFVLTPALMGWIPPKFPMPTQEQLDSAINYDNTVMDPSKSMEEYTDDELWGMHVYDFFSVAGKTVIRVGALYGTRRLIYEMNIKPGSRVLEVGSGRGATAFYLAKYYDCHVTCTDLSEYFLTLAQQAAEAHGVADRMAFVVGEEGRLAFDDSSFDVVLTEAVTMYSTTEFVFKEAYRVLKPGGMFASHEWSWPDAELNRMTGIVNNVACCCDMDGVTMYTKDGWHAQLEYYGFEVEWIDQFPFRYFSVLGLIDDESLGPVVKMFGKILGRKEALKKLLSIIFFLDKYQDAFTYTLSVNRKPAAALPAGDSSQPEPRSEAETTTSST